MRVRFLGRAAVGTAVLVVLLSGCAFESGGSPAASDSARSRTHAGSGPISVVASTDVWGDVVKHIAGNLAGSTVQITSIITDPAADPHSYEANTQNLLALSQADLVVENGGGYDDFVDTMLKSADNPSATVLNAVDISGKTAPEGRDLNEHVWYDFPTVRKVAALVVKALSSADPADATTFENNASAFDRRLASMVHTEAVIKHAHGGEGVAITEPVPLYLLTACGLVNQTPPDFSQAIEDGTDVSPAVLKETEDLFSQWEVALLAYNEQTSGPETDAVLTAARANHIPVVPVTETLPAGQDYLSWMRSNLAAIHTALSR